MAQIKWIKVDSDIFNDEKIQLIESLPDGDSIIVIWFKLLSLAGRSNNGGLVMFNDKVPYTDEMLVTIWRRKSSIIKLALETFESFGMIERMDNDAILIINWEKYQNIEGMEKIREQNRLRKQAQREREKARIEYKSDNVTKRDKSRDITQQNKKKNKKEDKEKEEEKDKELSNKEPNGSMSVRTDVSNTNSSNIDYSDILNYWNTHSGLKEIRTISDKRKKFIRVRVANHGVDAIYQVIDNCRLSSFMKGDNNRNWIANFDWVFGNPNNFLKVLEGNYVNESHNPGKSNSMQERANRLKDKYGDQHES